MFCPRESLLMTIFLTLREARGNAILWPYRGPSVPVYAMAGLVVPGIWSRGPHLGLDQ
jgi:hypothetical protein